MVGVMSVHRKAGCGLQSNRDICRLITVMQQGCAVLRDNGAVLPQGADTTRVLQKLVRVARKEASTGQAGRDSWIPLLGFTITPLLQQGRSPMQDTPAVQPLQSHQDAGRVEAGRGLTQPG